MAAELERRAAFYALRPGGWRDFATLLHPPYTLWHLSYVAIGAAAAPQVHAGRHAATLAAFILAVGIAAHSLDELHGRPLNTELSRRTLVIFACGGLGGAVAIGVVGAVAVSATLAPLVAVGGFLVLAYNLEAFGGAFHTDFWFAAAWGSFPALTGWWSNALGVQNAAGALAAAGAVLACFLISLAQRRLSTPVRMLRRRTETARAELHLVDGTTRSLTRADLAAPLDGALRALSAAMPLLAIAAVALRI